MDNSHKLEELSRSAREKLGELGRKVQAAARTGRRAAGPAAFLGVSTLCAVTLILTSLYTTSYAVTVNGETLGVVADRSTVDEAIQEVEQEGSSILGYDFQVAGDVDYQFGVTRKAELTGQEEIEDYFYSQLDSLNEHMRQCQVSVNGESVGVIKDEDALEDVLDEIQEQYITEDTVDAGFVENVTVDYVYAEENLLTADELRGALEANTTGETTYTAQAGDSLNKIAKSNDMTVNELLALNPGRDADDMLWVGDTLNVKETIPVLSVKTVEHQTYTQSIPSPVEEQKTDSMYKGESKIVTQGEAGEKEIEADVTFVNGVEKDRTVTSETVTKEPTATVKAVGTKEKPKTASTGSFSWPIRGRINSGFGSRYLFGRTKKHEGIDIGASYGATIKAADGGTVITAGWQGSLGKLVVIRHDNGILTYYGHNSSLLVSVGQKVYKGQAIAKAGSTGRSTGVHCHFGVKVNGTFVNPLKYLP